MWKSTPNICVPTLLLLMATLFCQASFAKLPTMPIYFVENQGQITNKDIKYSAKLPNASVFFGKNDLVYSVSSRTKGSKEHKKKLVRAEFVGGSKSVEIIPGVLEKAKFNFLFGKNKKNFKTDVPSFNSIIYKSLYKNIDLSFRSENSSLKSEYRVDPGGQWEEIIIRVTGAEKLEIDKTGGIVIKTSFGDIKEGTPFVFQSKNGSKQEIASSFKILSNDTYGFNIGKYDKGLPLFIDPVITYSSYLGGASDDLVNSVATDSLGNMYLAGMTYSDPFSALLGSYDATYNGDGDVFVSKISPSGEGNSDLLFYSYVGGMNYDEANGLVIDSQNRLYVVGNTLSFDFPTTGNAYDETPDLGGDYDGFALRLSATGDSLEYSTFLGFDYQDFGYCIALDSSDNVYVGGTSWSGGAPTSYEAYIKKLKFDGLGAGDLVWGRVFSGTEGDGDEQVNDIKVDSNSNSVYVIGQTGSTIFPTVEALQPTNAGSKDVFVAKISTSNVVQYCTFLGGSGDDIGTGIEYDSLGNVHLTGYQHILAGQIVKELQKYTGTV